MECSPIPLGPYSDTLSIVAPQLIVGFCCLPNNPSQVENITNKKHIQSTWIIYYHSLAA